MIKILDYFKKMKTRFALYARFFLSHTSGLEIESQDIQRIFVMLAADYGNLGDVAITYAQKKFLSEMYPNAEVVEIPISITFQSIKTIRRSIKPEDIITIVGGGNTGDRYDDIEYCRQCIIKHFPNNTVISFPQSVSFSNTIYGKISLSIAVHTYRKHNNLTLCARDRYSYDFFKKHFMGNRILLMPDIVLSLNESFPNKSREGVILCFRHDCERKISDATEKYLNEIIARKHKIRSMDTSFEGNRLPVEVRDSHFFNLIEAFKNASLVITDRLHGMIFCAITKTPCIVFDNVDCKISNFYSTWFNKYNYIYLANQEVTEEFIDVVDRLVGQQADDRIDMEYMSLLKKIVE